MRIGIILPGFSADESDWCIPVYLNLARGLAAQHDVRVFPIRYPYTQTPYRVYQAQVFPTGGGSYTRGLARWRMLRRTLSLIEAQHQQRPFDVLHAIWADETGVVANWAGKRLGAPTVVSLAGGELASLPDYGYGLQQGAVTRRLVRQAMLGATRLVAPCAYTARLALEKLPPEQHDKLRIVPLGVDTNLFRPPERELDWRPREYLHVGSLNPVKDQATLLRLVARLPSATLDIVGDGPLRGELEGLARALGIADRVIFHGAVEHDRLPGFYQEARLLLMTSRHEAFCMAAIEALACGAGVIGTAVGVLPEVGSTAPVGDVDALQELVIGRTRKHGEMQRTRYRLLVEAQYTVRHMVEGLLGVYEEALGAAR
jgi:glycosyltransferase involved in cell wall biosynthesis